MSRIGKQPVVIPAGVEITIQGNLVIVKGPKGQLENTFAEVITIEQKENKIVITPNQETEDSQALWGLTRALIANMVTGVTVGFSKKMEINGVGYRAAVQGKKLVLNLGFSHPVEVIAPEGIDFVVDKNNIIVSGIDKQLVGKVAAEIREFRKPEPYKGKGIRYENEVVRRKAGKKAIGGAK